MNLSTFSSSGMKTFFIKIVIYSSIFFGLNSLAVHLADGYSDSYYLRFTSPKQSSMIFGNSRSAQGIQPEVINELLDGKYQNIFNFSFTASSSPYGKVYFEAIKAKLDTTKKNGLFIISVDPWSVSNDTTLEDLRENSRMLATTSDFSSSPNFDYLWNSFNEGWLRLILDPSRFTRSTYLEDDGWLHTKTNFSKKEIDKRTRKKVRAYKNIAQRYKFSSSRLEYLISIIKYVNNHGDVVLVRLPIHQSMMNVENHYKADFNTTMNKIAKEYKLKYLDLNGLNEKFSFLDGHHPDPKSGRIISRIIAEEVLD